MLQIQRDISGKTWEYKLTRDGVEILTSDGYESKQEIFDDIKDILDSISEKNELEIKIEVNDDREDRSFIYQRKIEEAQINKNLVSYKYVSSISEIKPIID
jgi:hypothetical protein